MNKFPDTLHKAILIRRLNRFVAEVILNDEKINVYVPNTGRLSELALPGAQMLLSPINAKYKFKILYIIDRSFPVMIDSTYSNRLFHNLLKAKKVPSLDHYSTIKSEPVYGNHRFDFLLSSGDDLAYIELKSCTLFHGTTGAFPDAVSTRASEHVKALAESGKSNLIFLVLKDSIERFIPNYHTDFIFYETLKYYKNSINIRALAVQYDENLEIQLLKEIPVIIPEVKPEGIFLLILFNPEDKVSISNDGEVLEQGFYIYCGNSGADIFKTIAAIKRKNGINSILQDGRFSEVKIISDLPIVTPTITTDEVKNMLLNHGGSEVPLNDDSGNDMKNNLIYYKTNPAEQSWFWDLILELRFGE
jgi:sugar fermentation stimulation protein A